MTALHRDADGLPRTRPILCAEIPSCLRCRVHMHEVLSIAPLGHDPGLVAYECAGCGHLASVLQPPASPFRQFA
jgi:hypothetical protein